jgi:DNA-binding MarR family transcriptional regulator
MKYSESEPSASLRRFARTLNGLMQDLMLGLLARERNALARGRLTLPQMTVLDHVEAHGPCAMSSLAAAFQMNPSTATSLADRMVAMKLMRRERAEADRRSVMLSATAAGRRLVDKFRRERQRTLEIMFQGLTGAQRDAFLMAIRRAVEAMASPDGAEAQG